MIALLALAALQALLPAADGQRSAASGADSVAVLREARRAQERFERFHRSSLPQRQDYSARRCEEHVGRFVLSQGEEDDSTLPAEPEKIARARDTLIAQLARAQTVLPTDGWIAGQRIRYLIDARRPEDAVDA